jgi:hypothetical protein
MLRKVASSVHQINRSGKFRVFVQALELLHNRTMGIKIAMVDSSHQLDRLSRRVPNLTT